MIELHWSVVIAGLFVAFVVGAFAGAFYIEATFRSAINK